MFFNLNALIPWFVHYKYLVIFPIAVIEGPIITIITGFLASLGYLNLGLAYFVVVSGDVLGDSLYYSIGRFGGQKFVVKYGRYIGITAENLKKLEKHFDDHSNKTFIVGKLAHGTGPIILIASGMIKFSFRKFLAINAISSMIKSFLLIIIGYYFGQAYAKFNTYLNYTALILVILMVALYIIVIKTKILDTLLNKFIKHS